MQVNQEEARAEGRAEGEIVGLKKGRINALKETAITLAEMKIPIEDIAKAVNADIDIVKKMVIIK